MSERFVKVPQDIMRSNNINHPTFSELGLITFLLSHANNFKVTSTSICRQFKCDSRTLKDMITSLLNKGYVKELQAINGIELLLNNNTNINNEKPKKTPKNKQSKVNSGNNEVLLNYNSTIVKLQHQPLLNYNTRRIKENYLEKKLNKKVSKNLLPNSSQDFIDIKQEPPKTVKPAKKKPIKTSAVDLPEFITEEFIVSGKKVNPHIDLEHKYNLFRNSKINKNHTSTNWLNVWEHYLKVGINRYNEGRQGSLVYVNGGQTMDAQTKQTPAPVTSITEEEKQYCIQEHYKKLEALKAEYITAKEQYDREEAPLFNQKMATNPKLNPTLYSMIEKQRIKLSDDFTDLSHRIENEYTNSVRALRFYQHYPATFDDFLLEFARKGKSVNTSSIKTAVKEPTGSNTNVNTSTHNLNTEAFA